MITISNNIQSIHATSFVNTAYYNNETNWENGILYASNYIVDVKDISGEVVIKEGVKFIPSSAFRNCTALTSITIPDNVTSIGISALALFIKLPFEKSAPLAFCAIIIFSVSSESAGMNLSTIDIIIAKSCTLSLKSL